VTVLYFADTRFPIERANGVQTMATCHALAEHGRNVVLVVRPDTAPAARDPFEFYGVAPLLRLTIFEIAGRGSQRRRRLQFLKAAYTIQKSHRVAVVYTRDLGLAALFLRLPRAYRPRLVYESHGIAPIVSAEVPDLLGNGREKPSAAKLRRLERRERLVWTRAAAYVTITRTLADDLAARYGRRPQVFVVPDGARAVDTVRVDDADRSTPPIAAYAGHLYPWKGVDVFVRALALAPSVRGLIVGGHPGEPDRARIDQVAREAGVSDRLEVTGLVAPTKVAASLSKATILVLPNTASTLSERFTSPLKLFEYLQMGRPIVASDLPALREVLTTETAVFVPPGDAPALAQALERLAANPAERASLGNAARALAPDYTWARRAERLDAVFDAAMSGR
jgi:glycosyltransferase involved in cell wall biosynthesis